jgi:hypothetical protein
VTEEPCRDTKPVDPSAATQITIGMKTRRSLFLIPDRLERIDWSKATTAASASG